MTADDRPEETARRRDERRRKLSPKLRVKRNARLRELLEIAEADYGPDADAAITEAFALLRGERP